MSSTLRHTASIVALSLALTACGGGGGSSGGGAVGGGGAGGAQTDFEQGIFRASATYKDLCQSPRAGSADIQGSTEDENDWLRAWSNDLYLWYDEIADADPALYGTPEYFDLMRTFETTPSGAPKDQFHFTFDTEVWEQLSQTGTTAGYGADVLLLSTTVPRRAVVVSVQTGSPADLAGVTRGTVIVSVDGVDLINSMSQAEVDTLNAGLFPDAAGESHDFGIEDFDGANPRTVTIVSANVTLDTVPVAQVINTGAGPVGYLLFDSFLAPAESRLVDEIQNFANAGITELVLDLRYNGGGFLAIANELAYMIAGPSAQGQIFDETQFNDKHPNVNPVTGQTLSPDLFLTTAQGFSVANGTPLPTLNISRVFIISGVETGSASESVINGLRGINFPVILIGDSTTGKPYGFYPTDNCGTTYFSVQFRSINAAGFGDFADGFVPTETPVEPYEVQGCQVADNFAQQLGDPAEDRLQTALGYINTNDCSAAPIVINASRAAAVPGGGGQNDLIGGSNGAGTSSDGAPIGAPITKPIRVPGTIKTL